MNKLDLNAYGVSEMSNAEMRETEGGWICAIVTGIIALIVILVAT